MYRICRRTIEHIELFLDFDNRKSWRHCSVDNCGVKTHLFFSRYVICFSNSFTFITIFYYSYIHPSQLIRIHYI